MSGRKIRLSPFNSSKTQCLKRWSFGEFRTKSRRKAAAAEEARLKAIRAEARQVEAKPPIIRKDPGRQPGLKQTISPLHWADTIRYGDNMSTRLEYLKRQREFLQKELEPFLKNPHANPWAISEEEKLRDVEKEISELESDNSKPPDFPPHD